MKIVKIVSFICVLALVASLCSAFGFAAQPEAGDETRAANRCYVKKATSLYSTADGATTLRNLSVGQDLIIEGYGHTTTRLHVRMPGEPVHGYVLRSCVVETG
ncbi:MAG: hypothetical protein E7428_02200 [Ruminococcaceae bacterium]|nr:hypothetical protein [Oscillospiraceae bacterium]